MRPDMVESYVRDLLATMTGTRPDPDADGDLPVTIGGAQFYVRVQQPSDPVVQVFSVAAANLEETPGLLSALNEINRELKFARAFHVRGQVLFESEIWGDDVNPSNFQYACRNVASATDLYAPQIVESFGGEARFEESKEPDFGAAGMPEMPGSGAYL